MGTIWLTRKEHKNPLRSLSSHPKLQFCEVSALVLEKLRGADTEKSARAQVVSGSWWFRLCICWAMFPCGGLLPQDSQGLHVQTHLDCSAGASGLRIRDTLTRVVDCSAWEPPSGPAAEFGRCPLPGSAHGCLLFSPAAAQGDETAQCAERHRKWMLATTTEGHGPDVMVTTAIIC